MDNAILESQAHSLAGLVDVQAGSVVSRTLINKPSGTATLFAFDKDQSLSEHTAPFDALVLAIDGELEIKIAGQPHRVRRGEALIMPADVPHAVQAATRSKMLLVMIREQAAGG